MRSRKVNKFCAPFNAKTLISRNPVGISKKRKKSRFSRNQKCPQWIFKLSGIRVSHSKVFTDLQLKHLQNPCWQFSRKRKNINDDYSNVFYISTFLGSAWFKYYLKLEFLCCKSQYQTLISILCWFIPLRYPMHVDVTVLLIFQKAVTFNQNLTC